MIDEAKMANPAELSPRAAIAVLSLQLRSTVQAAIEAEAEADAVDADAALWQLRSRLAPLIEDRRRALEDEVAAERERAAEQIAAAHVEADRLVAEAVAAAAARQAADAAAAERRAAEEAALAEELAVAAQQPEVAVPELLEPELLAPDPGAPAGPEPLEPQLPPVVTIIPLAEIVPGETTPLFDDPMSEWAPQPESEATAAPEPEATPDPEPPVLLRPPTTMPMPRVGPEVPPAPTMTVPFTAASTVGGERQAMHVVIDAESFATAFAAALAPFLEARQQAPSQPPPGWVPVQAPAPKKSFWSHAWHPDVLLSGLAMVIVIIVLVAWTG
jgi:hypothetical protein